MGRLLVLRLVAVLVMAAAGLGIGVPVVRPDSARAAGALDLAALGLQPSDLPGTGWVHDGAFMEDPRSLANGFAAYWGAGTRADDVLARLTAVGWQRMYVTEQRNTAPSLGRVRSYVTQYADAVGAAAGFAYLEDERLVPSATDVAGTRAFGEESEITRDQGTSANDGTPFVSIDLTVRVGTLVGGVTLIAPAGNGAAVPDIAVVEALGATLEARLTALPASPGLGMRIARISDGAAGVTTYEDAYYRFAGADVPIGGETATATRLRVASYGDATDVYQLWQGIRVGDANGALYGVTLLRFPDDAAAGAWVADLATTLGQNPFYGSLRPLQSPTRLGDEAVALRYAAGGGNAAAPSAVLIAVRVGALVARIHVVPQGRADDVQLAEVIGLAERGAGCLGGDCEEYDRVPETLAVAPVATPAT